MAIYGMTTGRNEGGYIRDTLDNWGAICDGGIFVYCDDSEDATPGLCRPHEAVREVISSNLYDEDRGRMEWYKRQMLFNSIARFADPLKDWLALFDADEHLVDGFDLSLLDNPDINAIEPRIWDMYITTEDADLRPYIDPQCYMKRQWCSTRYRQFPFFIRFDPRMKWWLRNQHLPSFDPQRGECVSHGDVKHWARGFSVENCERKSAYYAAEWPEYAEHWKALIGKSIKEDYMDDNNYPLVKWGNRLAAETSKISLDQEWRRPSTPSLTQAHFPRIAPVAGV
jgi:hypothetical protein